ncbi:MAG: GTPase Era [Armatimonadota bacterium]|nr:GTPase Era [Armatimonadota bacterium]MDR7486921.1 GTPase Era [Armatimonadota bacterium]MDR7534539.1 GTPase Era [Armatimonadota bacterium]MDR7537632.1 GTPase Era [Armatimonadota bacterium]
MSGDIPAVPHRSGFVALAGRPNVGKSTLFNRLVGARVAITSPVPQTTRTVARGILTRPDAQVVFLDTPGLHAPRHRLGAWMVEQARRVLDEVDLIAWIVDAAAGVRDDDRLAARALRAAAKPVVLVVNKVDAAAPAAVEAVAAEAGALVPVAVTCRLSAEQGLGVAEFLDVVLARLPEGPPYYPAVMVTDQPEQVLVGELIREQIIRHTRDEVPHVVAVEVEEFVQRNDAAAYVRATVHVERPSQKKIVIGRGGQRLKAIGTAARREIETLLGRPVYLDLWVTVTPGWREKLAFIRGFYPG